MTSPRFIPADEAKRLREGVTPGPWRWYWDHGILALEGADTMPIATDLHVNDSDILTAAPDLAHTIIAQAEQIKRLQKAVRFLESVWGSDVLTELREKKIINPGDMKEL